MAGTPSVRKEPDIEPHEQWLAHLVAKARLAANGVPWLGGAAPVKRERCPAVPMAPPRVSLDENMKRAQLSADPFWFYNQVRNHGPWDYKQQDRKYQDFGNFNYGATAYSFGFTAQVAKRMAGWAQQRSGTSGPGLGDPLGSFPYGDDPHDQMMIDAGIKFRANRCRTGG